MMDSSHASGPSLPAQPLFSPEDRQLVGDCLKGLPTAWDAFVERFGGLLAFVIDRSAAQRRIQLTPADRDDLLADILLEILHHDAAVLRNYGGRSSLATYLAVVGRRVAVRGLIRMAARQHGHRSIEPGGEPARHDDGQMRLSNREQVERMLGVLEEMEARLVRLHHLEARSYGEISRLTGLPLGSIGPTLARAREKMKLRAD